MKNKKNKIVNIKFEVIYNTCTVCKKETKEVILCEECKKLINIKR